MTALPVAVTLSHSTRCGGQKVPKRGVFGSKLIGERLAFRLVLVVGQDSIGVQRLQLAKRLGDAGTGSVW